MKIKYKDEILKEADEKVRYLHIIRLKVDLFNRKYETMERHFKNRNNG